MTTRTVSYEGVRFSSDTIKRCLDLFKQVVERHGERLFDQTLKVILHDGQWSFDNEHEFHAALVNSGGYTVEFSSSSNRLSILQMSSTAYVTVGAKSRGEVAEISAPLDQMRDKETVESPRPETVVFIGHGRDGAWMQLRDHLRDKHHYHVECYEAGARAGHTIRDILESMILKSSFALLVMTAEDVQEGGKVRARQNVIHEAGLFQGKLGFSRAIILLEEGVEEFSNVQGVQYIPFSKGNIRETFGDVLATIKREFGR